MLVLLPQLLSCAIVCKMQVCNDLQAIHNREIDEKDRKMKFRIEQQKTELNNQVLNILLTFFYFITIHFNCVFVYKII